MAPKEKDLEPVTDLKTVQRYLKYGVEFHEIVSGFLEDADLRFEAGLRSVDPGPLTLEVEIDEPTFNAFTAIQLAALDRAQEKIRLSFSVNEATFYVHGKLQGRAHRRLSVRADLPMHKLQRREALRIKVLESHQASILLDTREYPLFDISAGGLSLVVGGSQQKDFPVPKAFPGSQLAFVGKRHSVDLEVMNVLPHGKGGTQVKVGFRFLHLPMAIEQRIAREAYLHTHKIWSRWL